MALRVLLADDCSTIKKVFQLTLQDYGVEVRTVNVGVDVLQIARKFQPDIIFTDLILQKRSGYDVSLDLKQDPEFKNTPVVIIRSGFMELDEDKYTTSKANAHLEKPFEVSQLRQLITHLVPKTQSQNLSQYLSMPEAPKIEVTPPPADFMAPVSVDPMGQVVPSMSPEPIDANADAWNIESFNPVTTPEEPTPPTPNLILEDDKSSSTEWVQQKVSRFKVDLDGSDNDLETALPVDYVVPEPQSLEPQSLEPQTLEAQAPEPQTLEAQTPEPQTLEPQSLESKVPENKSSPEKPYLLSSTQPKDASKAADEDIRPQALSTENLTEDQLTEMIHSQSREVIESIVWKIVPDLAKQIIEKEIERLIKEKT